jgi:hypothetical protein
MPPVFIQGLGSSFGILRAIRPSWCVFQVHQLRTSDKKHQSMMSVICRLAILFACAVVTCRGDENFDESSVLTLNDANFDELLGSGFWCAALNF